MLTILASGDIDTWPEVVGLIAVLLFVLAIFKL